MVFLLKASGLNDLFKMLIQQMKVLQWFDNAKKFLIPIFASICLMTTQYDFLFLSLSHPRSRSRPKLIYDQTQSSAHPCVPRPKLQDLDGSSSALRSGRWSGDGLIRGNFGLRSLIIGGFERTWV